jgi:hypothetical protein
MGKLAVIDHRGRKTTLSMVKFGLSKRILLRLAKKFRIVNRYELALFVPKYEIAVFDSDSVFARIPHLIFYYPDADTATRKWLQLSAVVEQGGLHGKEMVQFVRDGNPHEQGFSSVGLDRALANFFAASG